MTDIFTPTDVTPPQGTTYEDLVGEGKPYADNEALARSRVEANQFIEKLKQEQAELREELNKRLTAEEILTKIREQNSAPPQPTSLTPEPPKPNTGTPDINELVKKALSEQTVEQRKASNMATVTAKLAEKFGADAQLHLNKKAAELGVTLDYLKNLAQENPTVFYKTVDLDRPAPTLPTSVAPRNSLNVLPTGGERDKTYYQKLKASNPKQYFSPEIQMQQYKDMERALKAGKEW